MFKKILSLVLAAMMLCALSVTAFADSTSVNDENEGIAQISVSSNLPDQKVFVDIAWTTDAVTYSFGEWKKVENEYKYDGGAWDVSTIDFNVTNNSNCAIEVSGELSGTAPEGVTAKVAVEGAVDGKLELGYYGATNATGTVRLTIEDAPNKKIAANTKIGVKITVSAVAGSLNIAAE